MHALIRQEVPPTVLDEVCARLDKAERDVLVCALPVQRAHPVVIAWTRAVVVFAAADNLLNLPHREIFFNLYGAEQGRCHDALVLKRQAVQNGDALVRAALIFACDVEKDVLPTVAPVIRQTFFYALRALCEQKKRDVPPLIHDLPRFTPPRIGLLQKEIGRHAHAQLLAAFYFVVACAVAAQGIVKARFCAVNFRAVMPALTVEKIHIAVCAALAALHAPVPRVPNIVHTVPPYRRVRSRKTCSALSARFSAAVSGRMASSNVVTPRTAGKNAVMPALLHASAPFSIPPANAMTGL